MDHFERCWNIRTQNRRVYGETFTVQGPYAGVLGWPAQCAEGDRRCWPDAVKAQQRSVPPFLPKLEAAGGFALPLA